jgi:hypothetical protein
VVKHYLLWRVLMIEVLNALLCHKFYTSIGLCTRPSNQNGLGFSAIQAETDLERLKQIFLLLRDERSIFENWQKLVVEHSVLGKTAHDASMTHTAFRRFVWRMKLFRSNHHEDIINTTHLHAEAKLGSEDIRWQNSLRTRLEPIT